MIKTITSKENSLIKYAVKLKNTKFSKKEGKFLIESPHLIEMAKDYIDLIFTTEELDNKIYNNQIIVSEELLKVVANSVTPNKMVAIVKFPKSDSNFFGDFVYLDCVQDPGNVGTILRTCLAFGIKNVVLGPGSAYEYNFKTIQSSQGSIFRLNIIEGDLNFLKNKQKNNYKIVSTSLGNTSINLSNFNFIKSQNYAIILGNEGNGISKDILSISDICLKIEINGIDSLNVGIAGGIILYKLMSDKKEVLKNEE